MCNGRVSAGSIPATPTIMKKKLKMIDGESLHDWCERVAAELKMTDEQSDALREVSVQSYIIGSNETVRIMHNRRR